MTMSKANPDEPTGHRSLPHTADITIEAWAPTRAGCYAEAIRALLGTFADTSQVLVAETVPLHIEPASDEELLVALLEEVIYLLDVTGMLPAWVFVQETLEGGLGGTLDLAPLDAVALIGAAPKAVSREGIDVSFEDGLWTCHATIDV